MHLQPVDADYFTQHGLASALRGQVFGYVFGETFARDSAVSQCGMGGRLGGGTESYRADTTSSSEASAGATTSRAPHTRIRCAATSASSTEFPLSSSRRGSNPIAWA